jgi:hypothetical protein
MAAEGNTQQAMSPPQTFEDAVFIILGLILVLSIVQRIPLLLQEKLGIDIGSPYLVAGVAVTENTAIGTEVVLPYDTNYYRSRSDSEPAGVYPAGTILNLVDGPERYLQHTWWYVAQVEYPHLSGWVWQSSVVQTGNSGIDGDVPLGSTARAMLTMPLWKRPGSGQVVGEVEKGAIGMLVEGPRLVHGSNWWFFDTQDGVVDGWAPEDLLVLTERSQGWRRGTQVITRRSIDMFDSPGGGALVGLLSAGTAARIVGGPREIGGVYWWEIQPHNSEVMGWVPRDALKEGGVTGVTKSVTGVFVVFGTILTLALLGGIVYATTRAHAVRTRQVRTMRERIAAKLDATGQQTKEEARWAQVKQHIASENPNDWRLAIIEADVMLDELVARLPYAGTTLGERLKQANRSNFATLDDAWEAHKMRNRIAHDGSAFELTQREAQKTIARYENVLREFHVLQNI